MYWSKSLLYHNWTHVLFWKDRLRYRTPHTNRHCLYQKKSNKIVLQLLLLLQTILDFCKESWQIKGFVPEGADSVKAQGSAYIRFDLSKSRLESRPEKWLQKEAPATKRTCSVIHLPVCALEETRVQKRQVHWKKIPHRSCPLSLTYEFPACYF